MEDKKYKLKMPKIDNPIDKPEWFQKWESDFYKQYKSTWDGQVKTNKKLGKTIFDAFKAIERIVSILEKITGNELKEEKEVKSLS